MNIKNIYAIVVHGVAIPLTAGFLVSYCHLSLLYCPILVWVDFTMWNNQTECTFVELSKNERFVVNNNT